MALADQDLTPEPWAQRGARELGGDAVVSLVIDDAAAVKAGPVGLLCATASVAQWQ